MRRRRLGRARGFTLVELLVVVAICALVAAMAGSSMRSTRGEKATSFSRALVSHVNLVRHTAMAQQQPARLVAQLEPSNRVVYQLVSQVWSPQTSTFQDIGATLNAPVDVQICSADTGATVGTGTPTICPLSSSFALCFLASGAVYVQTPGATTCPTAAPAWGYGATIYVRTSTGDKHFKLPIYGLTGMAKLKDQW
jgi:prepilin-type N-terminal cleavage/methylation domain-containing protein